ncbi:hypothetical protein MTBBW1_1730034 [Desulfamplus magnetovallimortis]|uniref:Flagellar hook-length control protein-like C-terminal domain-containing protein n=1 Tax=Desulfamplus magnetovallimortis TaxID=1246637 RepID=A0A1W1H9W8_9BACT|nr:flagellar hook-length control protein FliK [Desulfamplus magnetovallimortis]SLM29236.1 hypothetical protein MTBBW1_1730034 [Desulfamplus magnetovallimortis]
MSGLGVILSELFKADRLQKKSAIPLSGKERMIDAKVLKHLASSKFELLIQGRKLAVDFPSGVDFKTGDMIRLKLNDQGELSVLKEKISLSGTKPANTITEQKVSVQNSRFEQTPLSLLLKQSSPFDGFDRLAEKLSSALKKGFESHVKVLKSGQQPELPSFKGAVRSETPSSSVAPSVPDKFSHLKPSMTPEKSPTDVSDKLNLESKPDSSVREIRDVKSDASVRAGRDIKPDTPVRTDGVVKPDAPVRVNQDIKSDVTVRSDVESKPEPAARSVVQNKPDSLNFSVKPDDVLTRGELLNKEVSDSSAQLNIRPKGSGLMSMTSLLLNISLKSGSADFLLIPRLLEKSGLLLEKKMVNYIQSNSNPEQKTIDYIQSNTRSEKQMENYRHNNSLLEKKDLGFNPNNPSDIKESRGAEKMLRQDLFEQNRFANNPETSGARHSFTHEAAARFAPAFDKTMPNPDVLLPGRISGNNLTEDLKSMALQLTESSDRLENVDIEAIKSFAQNLEKVQLVNTHLSESGKYLIPFPILLNGQFSFGQMFIDIGDKDSEKASRADNLLKVSLFLSMTQLGPVRADFSMLKNNISGVFQVSDPDTANFFNQMLPELTKNLQKHDYFVRNVTCRVVEHEMLSEKSLINEILQQEPEGFRAVI